MNGRRSRLARKATRVIKSEVEREFDDELGALRRELNETLSKAAREYDEALKRLNEDRITARKEAHAKYTEGRNALVKKMAKREELVAA